MSKKSAKWFIEQSAVPSSSAIAFQLNLTESSSFPRVLSPGKVKFRVDGRVSAIDMNLSEATRVLLPLPPPHPAELHVANCN